MYVYIDVYILATSPGLFHGILKIWEWACVCVCVCVCVHDIVCIQVMYMYVCACVCMCVCVCVCVCVYEGVCTQANVILCCYCYENTSQWMHNKS